MTNPFYTATGAPVQESRGTSPAIRNEFALVQTAFDEVFDAIDIGAASGTSTDSLTVGTGSKSFTIQAGRAFSPGQSVVLAYNTTPTTQMTGTITSYNSTTGAVVMNVTGTNGSGTYADWTLSLSPSGGATLGANVFTGVQDWATGANIASASTINLDTATGNRVHITGTTTITGWTLTRGPRTVIFDGALQLTYNATTNRLNSNGANVTVNAGDMAYIESDGTTVYVEVIKANGSAVVGVQTFGTAGAAQVIDSASSNNIIAICQLSSTRALVLYYNASQFPQIALVDQTGAKVSGHTPIQLEAVAGNGINVQIIKIDATTAVVAWGSGGTAVKAVHLTVSGSTVTAGALCTVGAENGDSVSLALLTTTKFVATYVKSVTNSLCARTLTLSGTTLTANTEYTLQASLGGQTYVRTAAVSSTQVQVAFCLASSNYVKGTLLTEASNVLTFPSVVYLSCHGASSNQVALPEVCAQTATRLIVAAGNTPENGGHGSTYLLDIGGSGSSATQQTGRQTVIAAGDGNEAHRMALLSANTFLHCSNSNTCPGIFVEALYTNGDGVRQGSAVSVARSTGRYDLCVLDATTALVAYVDSSNSNYPTVKPVALGTVS